MNAWERISLVEVATRGLFASDEALHYEEYFTALVDQAVVDALPFCAKITLFAEAAWHEYTTRTLLEYEQDEMDMRYSRSIKLARRMTMAWCAGELSKDGQRWLKHLNQSLDVRRAEFSQLRSSMFHTEVSAWERAALAQLGAKQTVTVTPVVTLAEVA